MEVLHLKLERIILIVIACLLLFGFTYRNGESPSRFEIAASIRNSGDGWKVVEDDRHAPLNIKKVVTEQTRIMIYYKNNTKRIHSFIVTPDETMTASGYRVGVSALNGVASIYIYDKDGNLINPHHYVTDRGNIWVYGVFTLY